MLVATKTKHSDFCNTFFKTSKAINLLHNKDFFLKEFAKQSLSPADGNKSISDLQSFKSFLKSKKLKLNFLAIGFDDSKSQYHIAYEIQSLVFKTSPLRIDRWFDASVPFAFSPCFISSWIVNALDDVPYTEVEMVALGH